MEQAQLEGKIAMQQLLVVSGFKKEDAEIYSSLFVEHEIDESILTSSILTNDLLKDVGVSKAGHRARILNIKRSKSTGKEGEDYNMKPTEELSLDGALGPTLEPGKREDSTPSRSEVVVSHEDDSMDTSEVEEPKMKKMFSIDNSESLLNRSKYIPLRLNEKERQQLLLVEAALSVSDYTGKVDIISYEKKSKRSFEQLKEICAVISGLLVASDYNAGQKMITNRSFQDNEEFFQEVFEVGRRHKIMNPEKMRSEYGKLVYLLQDSGLPEIEDLMQFNCKRPVRTVYLLLQERGALELLQDQNIEYATQCITDDKSIQRDELQKRIKRKEKAVEHIAKKYESTKISKAEIRLCLRSIGDNHSFLIGARDPLDQMITMLKTYFQPDSIEKEWSLSISYGRGGARLSHDHQKQYHYVLQSLTFWRNVTHDMFKLWILSEEDLLDATNRYRLSNTGQGLNRVQNCNRVGNAMSKLLSQTKRQLTEWIGSSAIHLGDHNVPNALLFIDKYTQIPRIINPVLKTVEQIDEMYKNPGIKNYIDQTFGGKEKVKRDIMTDFFRHAFDGSGADNFFDAGSCIDGRLTSAWNWCEKLPKKDFYPIFKLSGFTSFDGDFQR